MVAALSLRAEGIPRLDPELCSYLKPPPYENSGPKELDPWSLQWVHACDENQPWLVMSFTSESGSFPWCGLCGKRASADHLSSQKCVQKRDSWQISLGPFLQDMINKHNDYHESSPSGSNTQGTAEPSSWRRARAAAAAEEPEPPPAPAPGAVPREQRRKCLNPYCSYLEHELRDEFIGYCCKRCEEWEKENYKKKTFHGKRCQKEPAPVERATQSPPRATGTSTTASASAASSPEQPSGANGRTSAAEQGGADERQPEAEMFPDGDPKEDAPRWEHTFQTKFGVSDIWATAGVDPSGEMQPQWRAPGAVHGSTLVVVQTDEEAPEVLRMEVQSGFWVTLAERNPSSWSITSCFQEPSSSWNQLFKKAKHLVEAWYKPDRWWSWAKKNFEDFEKVQLSLRHALPQLEQNKEGLAKKCEERDEARKSALESLEGFLTTASKARKSACDWHGGAERIHQIESARQWADELKEGTQLQVGEEVKGLAAQHFKVVLSRNKMRSSDVELQNERDLEKQGQSRTVGESKLEFLQKERDKYRKDEKEATSAYFRKMAELCRKANRLAPEMLPALRQHTDKQISYTLSKLPPHEQAQVMQIFDHNISISHYDPDSLNKGKRLSQSGARHAVYEMRYEGNPCVVKVFDFHATHHSIPTFIQEVVLHVRLQHPLVVPLRRAFIDHKEHRGFLQFDRYECNLQDHLTRMRKLERVPHQFKEPAEAGMVDKMPSKITQMMILSVAHVHSHRVVHGDLKPSNWLWDAQREVPILCDFETAKDHGINITRTTTSTWRSEGYTAPELQDNKERPTLASDVFALGRSIETVLSTVHQSRSSERDNLKGFVDKMVCNEPSQRITAPAAAEAWWSEILSGTDGYQHLVRADEVLFTQAKCSETFSGGPHQGQPLETLIEAVVANPEYPLKDERLIIDVVKKGLALQSVDNRRLYGFREAQRRLQRYHQSDAVVWIKIREHKYDIVQERFVKHYDTIDGGKSIIVRGQSRRQGHAGLW